MSVTYDPSLNAGKSSLNDVKPVALAPAKAIDNTGSVQDVRPVKAATKVIEKSGSVLDVIPVQTEVKKNIAQKNLVIVLLAIKITLSFY
jgi:hypothetical protein